MEKNSQSDDVLLNAFVKPEVVIDSECQGQEKYRNDQKMWISSHMRYLREKIKK